MRSVNCKGRGCALFFVAGLLLALLLSADARAQLYAGSITGLVSDSSGGIIPGATVTLVDEEKGFSRSETTDSAGRYYFRGVPPGTYRLSVNMKGFHEKTRGDIVIEVNQNAAVDFQMQVGTVTESVEVNAAAPLFGHAGCGDRASRGSQIHQ